MGQRVWDQHQKVVDTLVASGAKAMTATFGAAAAVDATSTAAGPKVTITSNTHGFLGGQLYISGSVAYDGNAVITAVATNTITFRHAFTAETFAGTETASVILAPGVAFELLEVRMHLSAASATSENFTITLDNNTGSAYDTKVYSKDMNTVQDLIWTPETFVTFDPGDKLLFAWANTNARTWGIEVKFRRISRIGG